MNSKEKGNVFLRLGSTFDFSNQYMKFRYASIIVYKCCLPLDENHKVYQISIKISGRISVSLTARINVP